MVQANYHAGIVLLAGLAASGPEAEYVTSTMLMAGLDPTTLLPRLVVLNADGTIPGGSTLPTGGTSALFLRGDSVWANALVGPLNIGTAASPIGTLSVPVAPTNSTNFGLINIGSGPFDGSGGGFNSGNANSTILAINAASGYAGRLMDLQIAGVALARIGMTTIASGALSVLNTVDFPGPTVTITGVTGISNAAGFNYLHIGQPTYSGTVTVTNAATMVIDGAPITSGTTITNPYAVWVKAGAVRLDSTLVFSTDLTVARLAAASLRIGAAPSATPVANILTIGEASRPGTDTNTAGANGTIQSGLGTGTGTASSLIFQTPTVAGSGTGVQTQATRLTLNAASAAFVPVITTIAPGTASIPTISIGEANTGFYLTGTTELGITTGGVLITEFYSATGTGSQFMKSSYTFQWTNGDPHSGTTDLVFGRLGAANFRHGNVPSASPIANTLTIGESSRSGTDSNVAGANGTINSGTGTGTGTPAKLLLQSPIAVASGTGAQTQTTGLAINVGTAVLTNYTVATLPSAATAGAGATAFVTDGSTTLILGLGLTVVGGGANKVPVYSDGSAWIVG